MHRNLDDKTCRLTQRYDRAQRMRESSDHLSHGIKCPKVREILTEPRDLPGMRKRMHFMAS